MILSVILVGRFGSTAVFTVTMGVDVTSSGLSTMVSDGLISDIDTSSVGTITGTTVTGVAGTSGIIGFFVGDDFSRAESHHCIPTQNQPITIHTNATN
ncbi:hypothetical protein H6768_01200 [Candidatus Peribacteria bacterium]|nr:hypothetical protein [Candidatus Peribacteria bacterium]